MSKVLCESRTIFYREDGVDDPEELEVQHSVFLKTQRGYIRSNPIEPIGRISYVQIREPRDPARILRLASRGEIATYRRLLDK